MERLDIQDLIKRYNAGTASQYEQELVEAWYLDFGTNAAEELSEEQRAGDLALIWNKLPVHQAKVRRMPAWIRVAAAAAIISFIAIGVFYLRSRPSVQEPAIETLSRNLQPGGNKAVLTLSNGNQIELTNAENGQLAMQSNIAINKTAEGKLVYEQTSTGTANDKSAYNTVSTPLGGTYNLTLSDGTNVTLDAASSIRYPVLFNGNERRVEITGQAYFEVAHNKAKPFRVTSNGQTVEVLGTHFNINAYNDEGSMNTTLLEGSVKVSKSGQEIILVPGQQSVVKPNTITIAVKLADTEGAVAWKNGLFKFKRADLPTVMRQFARWYNVEVVYEGEVPDVAITGKVLRAADASQILKIVQGLGIKFKLDGKKIVILKNS